MPRRSFLRRSGAASVATVLALNGLKLEVRAEGESSGGKKKAEIYERIKITSTEQKKEVDGNGNIIGDAPEGFYVLTGGSNVDRVDAIKGHGDKQEPQEDDKQEYDSKTEEAVDDKEPVDSPTTKRVRVKTGDGPNDFEDRDMDIYEKGKTYKVKVKKIQAKAQ